MRFACPPKNWQAERLPYNWVAIKLV